jgi:L-lactate dehydrogenase complex protein LldG
MNRTANITETGAGKWHELWPDRAIDETLYQRFKANAEALTVTMLRASTPREAAGLIIEQSKNLNVQKLVSAPITLIDSDELEVLAREAGFDFSSGQDCEKVHQADMGISQFAMGIAGLGCIFQDASNLHTRLVSMLPPVHLALLPTFSLVDDFSQALEAIQTVHDGKIPPYLSFITGPSKTADIERELTIGVHGPGKLIILCIDQQKPRPEGP